jgi:hypothetical protein
MSLATTAADSMEVAAANRRADQEMIGGSMSLMDRRWTRRVEIVIVYGLPMLALLAFAVSLLLRIFVAPA